MTKSITIFDTAIVTDNLGDGIIMDAVMRELRALFPHDFFVHIPTHDTLGKHARTYARKSALSFVGGTNILCAHWWYKGQWKIDFTDIWRIGTPILLGVGWQFYQRAPDPVTAFMMNTLFSKKYKHSVRDSYTENRLKEIGITNVINTACPTMWDLTPEHCARIPTQRSENALITVTAYRNNPTLDKAWIDLVCSHYKTVYFWPQMQDDLDYAQRIAGDKLAVIGASLADFDRIIDSGNIDYIGTRLHGGIRVLQRCRRALIIEVDNRATEIARDTGLPTVKRDDIGFMKNWVMASPPITLNMPWDKIAAWKGQFATP